MTATALPAGLRARYRALPRAAEPVLLATGAVLGGGVVAALVARGMWFVPVAVFLALPGFVTIHRYPLATVTGWLVLAPLITITENPGVRAVYWLVHRALPPATVLVIVFGSALGLRRRALPRLGLPEVLMAGYCVATLLSIAYTSNTAVATTFHLYDRVVVPMCLYLVVRLLEPGGRDVVRLVPVVVFILVTQTLIGMISWSMPGSLPPEWLGKLGERTTGSLGSPEVFGTTLLFCGLLLVHVGITHYRSTIARALCAAAFVLVDVMVFMSFSRSVWLAGTAVTLGLLLTHRRYLRQMLAVVVPLTLVLLGSGVLTSQIAYAQQRLDSEQSEESALSRLPVMVAAGRMFDEKPITGWGYGNFDRFSRPFQGRVGDLATGAKDHASHNLFLTTLAEQGVIGFTLLFGPIAIWMKRSAWSWHRLPRAGVLDRRFVMVLWVALGGVFVVNNTYRFQNGFAFGLPWIVLGLIASVVARHSRAPQLEQAP